MQTREEVEGLHNCREFSLNHSSFSTQHLFQIRACVISARKAEHLDVTTMFTYSHANTPLGRSEGAYCLSYFIKGNRVVPSKGTTSGKFYSWNQKYSSRTEEAHQGLESRNQVPPTSDTKIL